MGDIRATSNMRKNDLILALATLYTAGDIVVLSEVLAGQTTEEKVSSGKGLMTRRLEQNFARLGDNTKVFIALHLRQAPAPRPQSKTLALT